MSDAAAPSSERNPASAPRRRPDPEPLLEDGIEVAATVERVWDLVSDLPRMAAWSPQVVRTLVLGGRPVRRGSTMVNLNRRGLLLWPTTARVVRFEPFREVAFEVRENRATWSFALQPTDGGTRLVQRREIPHGTTRFAAAFTAGLLGGQVQFQQELRAGMRQTLERIRAEAEAGRTSETGRT